MANTRHDNALHSLPFHNKGQRDLLLFDLKLLAIALEVSSAFKRAQMLAGSPLSRCLSSAAAPWSCSEEPLGQGALPAPCSGDELLRTGKGRPGNDITMLHEFPAGRLIFRFKSILPCPGKEADSSYSWSVPINHGLEPHRTFHPRAHTTFCCPISSPPAWSDCEHPAALGLHQIPVPAWIHCSAQGTAPAAPLSISQSSERFRSQG